MSDKQASAEKATLWRRKGIWIPTVAIVTALCVGGGYLVAQEIRHRQEVAVATSAYTDATEDYDDAASAQGDASDRLTALTDRAAKVYTVLHRIDESKVTGDHLSSAKTLKNVRTAAAELADAAQLKLSKDKTLADEETPATALSETDSDSPRDVDTLGDDVTVIEAATAGVTADAETLATDAEQLEATAVEIEDAIATADTRVDKLMASAAKHGGDASVDKAPKKKRKALSAAVKKLTGDGVADLTFAKRAKRLESYVKAYTSARKAHKAKVAAEKREAAEREAAQRNANSGGSSWGGGTGSGGGGSSTGGSDGSSSGGGGSSDSSGGGGSSSGGGGGSSSGGGDGGSSSGGGGGGGEPTGPAPLTVNGAAQGTSGECAQAGWASTTGGTLTAPSGVTNYTASWDGSKWNVTWWGCW